MKLVIKIVTLHQRHLLYSSIIKEQLRHIVTARYVTVAGMHAVNCGNTQYQTAVLPDCFLR